MAKQRDKRRDGIVITDLWRWRGRRGIGKRYLAQVRDGRLHAYKRKTFDLEADAKAWAAEQRHLLGLGQSTAARFELALVGKDLLERMERDRRGAQYIRAVRLAIEALEGLGVRDLASDSLQAQVRAYIQSPTDENRRRKEGGDDRPAPRTMKVRYGYVRAIIRHAIEAFRLRGDPLEGFRMPGGASLREIDRDGGGEAYSIPEVRKVLKLGRTTDPAWLAFVIGVYSGLRATEIRALRWEHIDFQSRVIRVVRGKGAKVRTVGLQPELLDILSPMSNRGGSNVKTGLVITLREPRLHTQHHLEPLLKEAGVCRDRGVNAVTGLPRTLVWHSCRRTFAAACLASGMDSMELGLQLGHTFNERSLTGAYANTFQQMKATIEDERWVKGRLGFASTPKG
jgi:integrase